MALTKIEIAEEVAKQVFFRLDGRSINKGRAKSLKTVETLIELIKQSLESGDDVLVSGFGKFKVNEKKERKGRNPATGESMMLGARRTVTFQCSRLLRNRINGGGSGNPNR